MLPFLLVIDDMPGVGASIRVMLRGLFDVVAVTEPAEALLQLRGETPFCAILCDVQLESSSLQELGGDIRALRPALAEKLLLMTGGAFPEDEHCPLPVPSPRRLLKPFSTEQLLKALATVDALPGVPS